MKLWLLVPVLLLAWFVQGAELVPKMLILSTSTVTSANGQNELKTKGAGTIIKGDRHASGQYVWEFKCYLWGKVGSEESSDKSILLRFQFNSDDQPNPDAVPDCGVPYSTSQFGSTNGKMTCTWNDTGVYYLCDKYLFNKSGLGAIDSSSVFLTWTFLIFWEEEE